MSLDLQPNDLIVVVDEDIIDIVPLFLDNQRKALEKMQEDMADRTLLRRAGHSMKGVGGMYGFDWISRFGAVLEGAAERHPEQIPELLEQLGWYLGEVRFTAGTA
jgi:HPt (histidine-containing phosphotransfer) domain-containing protein